VVYPEIPAWELAREEAEPTNGIPYDIEKIGWKQARESAEAQRAYDALPE
jgi:hypothetical protein